jgi:hypothetical protein
MQLITHQSHLDALPDSPIKDQVQVRFEQLSQDTDIPPAIFLLEKYDDPTSPELSFLGSAGMCSDLFEICRPEDPDFAPVFEWICYLPELKVYEMLYLEADLGYWFIVKKETVESSPSLKAVIKSQGLSEPQPSY